jgi:hypothetical protein
MCPPSEEKVALPPQLLELIDMFLDRDSLDGAAISAAQRSGFWFLLRSIEYLANDEEFFDGGRSLTWDDVTVRDDHGELLSKARIADAHSMTYRVYSGKGSLHTCTRTVFRDVQNPTCPVGGIINLYQVLLKEQKRPPRPDEAVFKLSDGSVLSRKRLAEILKSAAMSCGVPGSRVATHSLRRGGASTYAAAGVPDEDIQRFGRWTSDGYRRYVSSHANMMRKGNACPFRQVPRFERN